MNTLGVKTSRVSLAGISCAISEPDSIVKTLQTIICLHGIGGDEASFAPQLSELANQYRVVAWNMPGYNGSARVSPLTFETLNHSLQQLIVALGDKPVHLLGQSIGGMIAQEAFHRNPQHIKSLILVATTAAFGGKDDSFKEAFLAARLQPLDEGKTMAEVASAAMPSIVAKNADQAIITSAIASMAPLEPDVYREVLKCLVTFNRRSEWTQINCPLCVVSGDEDTNAPAATMRKMADKLPHADYHKIKNAGHLVNLERGAEFNQIVRSFLKQTAESP